MPQQRLFPVAEENEEDADAHMDISYLGCRFVLRGKGWYLVRGILARKHFQFPECVILIAVFLPSLRRNRVERAHHCTEPRPTCLPRGARAQPWERDQFSCLRRVMRSTCRKVHWIGTVYIQ
jgi:hypothetical protein